MNETNNEYITIYQWMRDLFPTQKGKPFDYAKLLLFAYIYSYSRDGQNKWFGKQQQLAKLCFCGEDAAYKKLKELVNDGLIIKEEVKVYGMLHRNKYWVNPEYLPNTTVIPQPTAVIPQPTAVIPEPTKYNITDKIDNIYSSISKDIEGKSDNSVKEDKNIVKESTDKNTVNEKTKSYKVLTDYINNMNVSDTIKKELLNWYDNIGKGRVSLSQLKAKIKDISEQANGDENKIANAIHSAYLSGWFGFYLPKTNNNNKSNKSANFKIGSKTEDFINF